MYIKRSIGGIIFLTLYVDDILLAGKNIEMIKTTKKWPSFTFEMKDMGEARYVLGVEIIRDRSRKLLGLCQKAYIEKVLERFRMHYSKPVDTPVEKGLTLSLEQCPTTDNEKQKMSSVPYANCWKPNVYHIVYTA